MADAANKLKKPNKKTSFGPISAILVTLGIYFGSQILALLVMSIYALLANIDRELAADLLEGSAIAQFFFIFMVGIISVYLLWIFLGYRQINWKDIGVKKPRYAHLIYAPLVYLGYLVLALIAFGLVKTFVPGIDIDQEQQIGFENATGSIELSLVFASLVLVPAVVEEILVRGFLYGGLVKKFSKWIAAFLASGIFAVAHLQFGSGEPLLWIAAVDTFVLSMVLIWLREKTGNIWSGVFVHMIKNSVAFVSLFILKLP